MSMSIDDAETIESVTELASRLNTTTAEAVRLAVRAELDRVQNAPEPDPEADEPIVGKKFDQRLAEFYRRYPRPVPTGLPADKAFFDDLSGEFD